MELSAAAQAPVLPHLSDLVRRYQVYYDVSPDRAVVDGELRAVGFTVELAATHDHPKHEPFAGCDECAPVVAALREILAAVVPSGPRASYFVVHESRVSHRYSSARGNRPEMTASVEIVHRDGANLPIDECEESCRDGIVARLKAIGASEGAWRQPS